MHSRDSSLPRQSHPTDLSKYLTPSLYLTIVTSLQGRQGGLSDKGKTWEETLGSFVESIYYCCQRERLMDQRETRGGFPTVEEQGVFEPSFKRGKSPVEEDLQRIIQSTSLVITLTYRSYLPGHSQGVVKVLLNVPQRKVCKSEIRRTVRLHIGNHRGVLYVEIVLVHCTRVFYRRTVIVFQPTLVSLLFGSVLEPFSYSSSVLTPFCPQSDK